MMVRKEIDLDRELTPKQKKMLQKLAKTPAVPDDDAPELTQEQLSQMHRISEERAALRRKQTITLRISPQALKTAKMLGKGYTAVLSRILEAALADSETIKHFL